MKISEALDDAMENGMDRIAYTLLWVVQKGLHKMNSPFDSVDFEKVDHDEVTSLIATGALGIKPVELYSMHIVDKLYIFVFSYDETGAKQLYYDLYKRFPKSVGDATSRMDLTMWSKEDGYRTFREIKDATLKFPAVALVYEKENKTVKQVEEEYYQMFGKRVRELKGES